MSVCFFSFGYSGVSIENVALNTQFTWISGLQNGTTGLQNGYKFPPIMNFEQQKNNKQINDFVGKKCLTWMEPFLYHFIEQIVHRKHSFYIRQEKISTKCAQQMKSNSTS